MVGNAEVKILEEILKFAAHRVLQLLAAITTEFVAKLVYCGAAGALFGFQ